jgi:diacylglycerol kinase
MPSKNYIKAFGYAFSGIRQFFLVESNALVHTVASIVVITGGVYFHVSSQEWLWLILAIALVFMSEIFNSAIELLCNFVQEDIHPKIKPIKDLAAAGVLIASIFALVAGLIIFVPYLLH